jgi:hypothetical protein
MLTTTPTEQPGCEICEALPAGGARARSVEVRMGGTLLCSRHAALLELKDISETLLGMVCALEKRLESPAGKTGAERLRRVRCLRDDVLNELRFTRGQPQEVVRGGLREGGRV